MLVPYCKWLLMDPSTVEHWNELPEHYLAQGRLLKTKQKTLDLLTD